MGLEEPVRRLAGSPQGRARTPRAIGDRLVDEKFDVCITSYEMILREKAHLQQENLELQVKAAEAEIVASKAEITAFKIVVGAGIVTLTAVCVVI